ncbi:hypothetical protein SAMN05216167_103336 [Spirosoma endophyticum]|uniref:Uncharacterized protein n=1 Tax=Spirosoma endophyticum TaxID=662367 RepID=A0A1I1PUN7_9BACT|nr:hypothetical protein SAMN05216167_103336 [Spirosoma endophyticum]
MLLNASTHPADAIIWIYKNNVIINKKGLLSMTVTPFC